MPSTARLGRGESASKRRDENRIGETVTELFGDEALDAQTALKLEALAALHERKVGALMKSISAQKEELAKLKAASREHRRSQLIQDLRNQVREQELAVDVLKEALVEGPRGQLTQEAVNELVILRTLGGPKRFRPKTREELQNELLNKPAVVKRTIRRREAKPTRAWEPQPTRTPIAEEKECKAETPRVLRDTGNEPEGLPSAAHLRELAEASAKAEQAEVAVARADLRVAELQRELDALRAEKFAAERKVDDLQDDASRAEDLRRRLEETRRQVSEAERDCARAAGERDAWQLELEHARASNDADIHALKADLDAAKEELAAALSQEAELQAQCRLERERGASSSSQVKGEVSALRKELATAERQLKESERSNDKLRRQLEKSEADCKSEREALARDMKRARNAEREAARKEVRDLEVRTSQEKRELEVRASQEQDKVRSIQDNDAVAAAKAELLQQHVDALRDELRRKDDDLADQRATSDAERQALQEKCNSLEIELEKCRGQASLDVQAAERRADSLAKEARALQARADRLEELGGSRRRKPASSGSSSSSKTPRSEDDDEELYHTRAALAAHMRLADAYANQHALQQAPDDRAEQLNERVLARARRDLEKALAGSRPLGAFYSRMLERIESRSNTVPLKKGGPPPRPKPQSQKREQRIHHGRGTHSSLVDGTPPPDLARLEIRGGHRSSSSSESGSLDDRFDVDDDHLDYSQSSVSAKSSRTYDPDAR